MKSSTYISFKTNTPERYTALLPAGLAPVKGLKVISGLPRNAQASKDHPALFKLSANTGPDESRKKLNSLLDQGMNIFGVLLSYSGRHDYARLQVFVSLKTDFPSLHFFFHVNDQSKADEIQFALDTGFDGLYVDIRNQAKIRSLLKDLQFRTSGRVRPKDQRRFGKLRSRIGKLDEKLVEILAHRSKAIRELGMIKKKNNMKILQLKRWEDMLAAGLKDAGKKKLNDAAYRQIIEAVHLNAILEQAKVYRKKRS